MAIIEIEGRKLEVDGDGFLTDPKVWDENLAAAIARHDGINEMTDKHWAVIKIIDRYDHGLNPENFMK